MDNGLFVAWLIVSIYGVVIGSGAAAGHYFIEKDLKAAKKCAWVAFGSVVWPIALPAMMIYILLKKE